MTDCQKRECESRSRKAPFPRLSGVVVEPYPWFSFSVLRNVHNWIVLYRFRKVQQGEGERGSTCYRSPRGRSFCIIQELGGRRRRHPRATIWIAIRPEQGIPSSLLPLMVLIAFYDAQEKHAEQWRRGLILEGQARQAGGGKQGQGKDCRDSLNIQANNR